MRRMLYRPGTTLRFADRDLDYRIVGGPDEEAEALAEGWWRIADILVPKPAARIDPLDHDGDGRKGGSLAGEQSTRRKGRRKKSGRP